MIFTKEKWFGAGIVLAAVLCLSAPQEIHASTAAAAVQPDGVMGQSLEDETLYDEQGQDLYSRILKSASRLSGTALLGASGSYTTGFLESSFTTSGDFVSATYYHKNDYESYNLFNGIDVSWWQSKGKSNEDTRKISALDWEEIHNAGIDFAFVRVASRDTSDGSIYEDDCANSHIQGALANNINVGLYVFSQALTEDEAVEEAEYVLDLADKYGWKVTMPIVIDREAGSYKRLTGGKLTRAEETAVCQAFADTITDAGYEPTVYASYTWIKNYIDTAALEDCSIWISRYNNTTTSYSRSGTAYSDVTYNYEFWQYSSTAKVDGYTGSLDANFWYKDTSVRTTSLKMKSNTGNSVTLSWSAAGDAQGYRVYRYDEDQEKYVYLGATTKKSYTDTELSSGKLYRYRVRGYWTIGGTKYFGAYSPTITAATIPAQVQNVAVEQSTTTSMTIKWDKLKNTSGYRIYQFDDATDSFKELADVAADVESYKISDLESATEYRFQVKAYVTLDDDTYWGPASEECAGATSPAAAQNLLTETKSATAVGLTWDKVAGATGYQIYRLNAASGKYEKIATVKGASTVDYTDSGLKSGAEYFYKVRAYKTFGGKNYYGSFSSVKEVVTKPAKVANLKLATKSSAVTLTWDKVSGATGYQVYRLNKTTGKYEKIATVKGATVTYKNTKLQKGTSYTYKIRAYKTWNNTNYFGSFSTTKKITVK